MATIDWEQISTTYCKGFNGRGMVWRAKITGGWLLQSNHPGEGEITFIPDPHHEWDGNSLPLER